MLFFHFDFPDGLRRADALCLTVDAMFFAFALKDLSEPVANWTDFVSADFTIGRWKIR